MLETLGFHRRVLMEDGRAAIEFMAGAHMCHSGGIVQGGFVTGWIDAAMAHAVFSLGRPDVAPAEAGPQPAAASAADSASIWEALSRGDDPTAAGSRA